MGSLNRLDFDFSISNFTNNIVATVVEIKDKEVIYNLSTFKGLSRLSLVYPCECMVFKVVLSTR